MENLKIREAAGNDLPAINDIFNHYVTHSTCTWQTEPSSLEARKAWSAEHGPKHPVIVAECGGQVVGWGSLSVYRNRNGYRHTVENSVYVRDDVRGKGIGKALLADLLARARAAGHRTIVAIISGDQEASIRLHEKFGFEHAGRLKEAGNKFDCWLDVVFMQKMLT